MPVRNPGVADHGALAGLGDDDHNDATNGYMLREADSSVVDNTLVRWDGTGGRNVQESSVILNDAEEMSGLTKLDVDNLTLDGSTVQSSTSITFKSTNQFRFEPVPADTNIAMLFIGTSNSGEIDWMEDENYFKFFDAVLLNLAFPLYFRDTDIGISSADDGHLDFAADVSFDFNAPADTDITMNFAGTTNSGAFKWMEDEDYFEFTDDILLSTDEKIIFRDADQFIHSSSATVLVIESTESNGVIQLNSPFLRHDRNDSRTFPGNAHVRFTQGGAGDAGYALVIPAFEYFNYIDNSDSDKLKFRDETNGEDFIVYTPGTSLLELGIIGSDVLIGDSTSQISLRPETDTKVDIGEAALRFRNGFLSGFLQAEGGIITVYSEDDIADPPTDANLDAAFGTPAALGPGFIGIIDDNSGDTDVWICFTNDVSWFYLQGIKAT